MTQINYFMVRRLDVDNCKYCKSTPQVCLTTPYVILAFNVLKKSETRRANG